MFLLLITSLATSQNLEKKKEREKKCLALWASLSEKPCEFFYLKFSSMIPGGYQRIF
jgi:hypothetical protein